jgi:sirohydrochlorin ferrochelatase
MHSRIPIWILVAHGSRVEAANQEIRELARSLSEKSGQKVKAAFLELASPSIPEALDSAAAENPAEIAVLPYFLTQGRHLSEDIPRIVQEKAQQRPDIPIRILNYVGSHPGMVDFLQEIADRPR